MNFCLFDVLLFNNNNHNKKRNRRFSRKHHIEKKREKRKRVKLNRKERIRKAKEEGPDQNAINLSSKVLTTPQKSVLAKGPSFIPTPNDVNWLNVRKDLHSFINQLRYFANNAFQEGQEVEVPEIAKNCSKLRARKSSEIAQKLLQIKSKKELIQKYLEIPPKESKIKLVQCTSRNQHQIKIWNYL